MSKYRKLTEHLVSIDEHVWPASFIEVEEVLGMPLPESARQYNAWWANQGRGQSWAWQGAGWKTSAVDLKNERVTFVYVGDEEPVDSVQPLTIAEAKAGLAAHFSISPESVEIVIRG